MKSSVLCQTFTASGSSCCQLDPMAFLLADSVQSSLQNLSGARAAPSSSALMSPQAIKEHWSSWPIEWVGIDYGVAA
jgi:hypothetical protein